METVLIYAAPTTTGSSASIANKLKSGLNIKFEAYNINDGVDQKKIEKADLLLFVVATYGDQELSLPIEDFFTGMKADLSGKYYGILELGNYYGYDDYSFGSGHIVGSILESMNAKPLLDLYSMDTLPQLDWKLYDKWVAALNKKVESI